MPRLRTRQWIRDQAREIADEVGSTFITDATANEWINQGYAKLVDMLVAANPDWYVTDFVFVSTVGTKEYTLPNDFYEVRAVDMIETALDDQGLDQVELQAAFDDHDALSIEPYNFLDRNRYSQEWPPPRWNTLYSRVRYRVIRKGTTGDEARIRFEPEPGRRTFRLWYVRATQDLDDDLDNLDGVNGYEEYIVGDVAHKMLIKSETDPSGAIAMKNEAIARIEEMAHKRDQGRPVQVADTRFRNSSRRFYP